LNLPRPNHHPWSKLHRALWLQPIEISYTDPVSMKRNIWTFTVGGTQLPGGNGEPLLSGILVVSRYRKSFEMMVDASLRIPPDGGVFTIHGTAAGVRVWMSNHLVEMHILPDYRCQHRRNTYGNTLTANLDSPSAFTSPYPGRISVVRSAQNFFCSSSPGCDQ
jgi:hypothetical protein